MGRLLRIAAVCRRAIRKKPAVRNTFAVSLVALGACLPFLALMATKTSSFEEGLSVCGANVWATHVEIGSGMDDEAEAAEHLELQKSNASNSGNCLPHVFNAASAWFSLACFLLWMFVTPHTSPPETHLSLHPTPPPPPPLLLLPAPPFQTECFASTPSLLIVNFLTVGSFYGVQVLGSCGVALMQSPWGYLEPLSLHTHFHGIHFHIYRHRQWSRGCTRRGSYSSGRHCTAPPINRYTLRSSACPRR
jgi:hypothetical protein